MKRPNLLLDPLPECVEIDGAGHAVNWGYRAMVLIEICMFDGERDEEQRTLDALNIFYNQDVPPNLPEALERLMWFYRCGKLERREEKEKQKRGAPVRQESRCYCFDQDAPYIYAAFLTQYGMDLNSTRNLELHWWKFHAMFEALGEELKISRIMHYRAAPLSGQTKENRRFLNEMKKLYALEDPGQTVDGRLKLAKRNAAMKAYVERRTREAHGNDED